MVLIVEQPEGYARSARTATVTVATAMVATPIPCAVMATMAVTVSMSLKKFAGLTTSRVTRAAFRAVLPTVDIAAAISVRPPIQPTCAGRTPLVTPDGRPQPVVRQGVAHVRVRRRFPAVGVARTCGGTRTVNDPATDSAPTPIRKRRCAGNTRGQQPRCHDRCDRSYTLPGFHEFTFPGMPSNVVHHVVPNCPTITQRHLLAELRLGRGISCTLRPNQAAGR